METSGSFFRLLNRKKLTYNEEKCVFSTTCLNILGSVVSQGRIMPDPDRLRPWKSYHCAIMQSLKRIVRLFAYYSKWIPRFSDKIAPLVKSQTFPLSDLEKRTFNALKDEIRNSVVTAVDEQLSFEVETDASDIAISAMLNQGGRPVAFFSRTLTGPELHYPAVEKEACAIIESVRKWRYYLTTGTLH